MLLLLYFPFVWTFSQAKCCALVIQYAHKHSNKQSTNVHSTLFTQQSTHIAYAWPGNHPQFYYLSNDIIFTLFELHSNLILLSCYYLELQCAWVCVCVCVCAQFGLRISSFWVNRINSNYECVYLVYIIENVHTSVKWSVSTEYRMRETYSNFCSHQKFAFSAVKVDKIIA